MRRAIPSTTTWEGLKQALKQNKQEYDNTLKALFGDEASDIIPNFFIGAVLLGEENIEIDRSKLKADLVYRVLYDRTQVIINLELQTSPDKTIGGRLLQYAAGLYMKHELPVISVVIYPFQIATPPSPFRMASESELFLSFHYKTICLWELDAAPIVKKQALCMYTLLPAMKGATADLLKQALREMAQRYTRQQLGHHLLRFHRIMQRAKTMTDQDKQEVEEELFMQYGYDEFIDDNPLVIERMERSEAKGRSEGKAEGRAEGRAEGHLEGKAEGQVLGLQQAVLNILGLRFPHLVEQAQPAIANIQDPDQLDQFVKQLIIAPDTQTVQKLFHQEANEV